MPHSVLLIGQDGWNNDVRAAIGLDQRWRFVSLKWTALTVDRLTNVAADLVVAVAVGQIDKALVFFRQLRVRPIGANTFAVLPAEANEDSIQATAEAVDDFVVLPARPEEFQYRVARLLGHRQRELESADDKLVQETGLAQLVGCDPVFLDPLRRIPAIARNDAPVLITGETGTGKEICARTIHHLGRRRDFPLIPVDCAGIPHQLFENELFGHARGAFTDAKGELRGLVAMAEGGTLFLDEIDALDLRAQAKLLRFLQEGMYKPLGADRFWKSNVRLIAATNQPIEILVRDGQFRSDLYYRLNVLRLELPPLRKRRGDIPILAIHFLSSLGSSAGQSHKTFSQAALIKLSSYDWPGNVRELRNVVQRACVYAEDSRILPSHITLPTSHVVEPCGGRFHEARIQTIEAFERRYVEEMIRKHNGNVTHAALEAGKERRAFGRLIKKYGISRVDLDPAAGSLLARSAKST